MQLNQCDSLIRSSVRNVHGTSVSVVDRPAGKRRVTGDWYDVYALDSHRVLLTVGDVMGHGLQASIVKARLCREIRHLAKSHADPAAILDEAEIALSRCFPGAIATAFVGILDFEQRQCVYANAGHPYPLLRLRNGSLVDLKAEGLLLGLRIVGQAQPVTQSLENAALLALYTDGLTEVAHDAVAGEKRLREAVGGETILSRQNAARFVYDYCVGGQTSDDVVVLVSTLRHLTALDPMIASKHEKRSSSSASHLC